jgi:hypothetical protein
MRKYGLFLVLVASLCVAACDPSTPTEAYSVSLVASEHGGVTLSPEEDSYGYYRLVVAMATPAAGYVFSAWAGDISGTTNPTHFRVESDMNVGAVFAELLPSPLIMSSIRLGTDIDGADCVIARFRNDDTVRTVDAFRFWVEILDDSGDPILFDGSPYFVGELTPAWIRPGAELVETSWTLGGSGVPDSIGDSGLSWIAFDDGTEWEDALHNP